MIIVGLSCENTRVYMGIKLSMLKRLVLFRYIESDGLTGVWWLFFNKTDASFTAKSVNCILNALLPDADIFCVKDTHVLDDKLVSIPILIKLNGTVDEIMLIRDVLRRVVPFEHLTHIKPTNANRTEWTAILNCLASKSNDFVFFPLGLLESCEKLIDGFEVIDIDYTRLRFV